MIVKELVGIRSISSNLFLDFLHMIEVEGKCAVNISEGNARDVRDDLVGSHASALIPNDDVLHTHAVASDTSPSAACSGRFYNSFIWGDAHRDCLLKNRQENLEEFHIYKIIYSGLRYRLKTPRKLLKKLVGP